MDMKKHLILLASYCMVFAITLVLATSCKAKKPGAEKPIDKPVNPEQKDTIARISLFSADSTELAEAISFEKEASTQKFIVDTYIKGWKAEITGNDIGLPWLTCEPITGPTGRTEVTVAVTANDIELSRSGSIVFTQDSTGLTKVVNISQNGIPPMETDITTDSLALIAIYNAFNGKDQSSQIIWDLKKPVGSENSEKYFWPGVWVTMVDGKRRVTALDFENSAVKGDIPAELGNLRALTSLRFVVNRVKGVLPNGLSLCKELKTIDIKNSWGITGLPKDIGMLSELETLIIAGSSVSELPEQLSKCAKLKEINASPMYEKVKERLKGNLNKILVNKPALENLYFGNTELTGDLSFLKEAPSLMKIEFIANKLSGDMNLSENLKNSKSLEYLTLGSSPELTGTLAGLKEAQKLTAFQISDSKVGGSLDLAELHLIPSFATFWAPNNEFTGNLSLDFVNGCKSMNNISMNKLNGTLTPEVQGLIKGKFIFKDRICPQKEGFGFTNCEFQ